MLFEHQWVGKQHWFKLSYIFLPICETEHWPLLVPHQYIYSSAVKSKLDVLVVYLNISILGHFILVLCYIWERSVLFFITLQIKILHTEHMNKF